MSEIEKIQGYTNHAGEFVVTGFPDDLDIDKALDEAISNLEGGKGGGEAQSPIDSNRFVTAAPVNRTAVIDSKGSYESNRIVRIAKLLGEESDGFVRYAFKNLDNETVNKLAEQALNGKNPGALFNYLVKNAIEQKT